LKDQNRRAGTQKRKETFRKATKSINEYSPTAKKC